ncbi:hypothetical protein CGRA01v4_03234 [Colletotrichum graminicola]|nr:hypothetical protein CGRA01v4_03234 [Colletotrichum graminicola]
MQSRIGFHPPNCVHYVVVTRYLSLCSCALLLAEAFTQPQRKLVLVNHKMEYERLSSPHSLLTGQTVPRTTKADINSRQGDGRGQRHPTLARLNP